MNFEEFLTFSKGTWNCERQGVKHILELDSTTNNLNEPKVLLSYYREQTVEGSFKKTFVVENHICDTHREEDQDSPRRISTDKFTFRTSVLLNPDALSIEVIDHSGFGEVYVDSLRLSRL
jgi:hypothetical protein